jgi:outer membrane protein OmpA-like peptidoglycan-associated protein
MLAFHMLMLSGPCQSAWAVIISTEASILMDSGERMRDRLGNTLMTEDIEALLESRGIDPAAVRARMDSLTDAELEQIAEHIDQLPAGGGFFETFLIVIFLVFVVLLFTDITGYTDVFPFVNKQAAANSSRSPAAVKTSQPIQTAPSRSVSGTNPDGPLIVYFNSNSNDLTAKAYERLDGVALFMTKNPQTKITVIGFSDATGTSSYDQMVAEVRANTVKNYLIAKGVAPSKISTAADGTHAASNQTNSRVEIEFK